MAVEFALFQITKPGYPYAVYVQGTNTLASLFTDTGGLTAAPNPANAWANGTVIFYAASGSYDVVVEGGRFPVVSSSGGGIDSTFALSGDLAGTLASPTIETVLRGKITGAEQTANKGAANGYASLGAGGRVPVAQLASGTPDGTKFLRDDGAFAVPAGGGGAATATMNGVINVVDAAYGAVLDEQTVTDGVVAAGSLDHLASAAGKFAAGDVGKTVTLLLWANITDATIGAGGTTITSAGNQVPSWLTAGMPVRMSSAGASAFSLATTVLSAAGAPGSFTVNNAATGAVTARNAIVAAIHRTTIATFIDANTVTLTAAAPYAFAGATVAWGTENRAAFQLAAAAAVAAGKTLYVPGGDIGMALDATNPSGYQTLTSTLTMRCSGRFATRFHFFADAIPTADTQLILAGTGSSIDLADFKVSSYNPPVFQDSIMYGRIFKFNKAGTVAHYVSMTNVDTDSTYRPSGAFYMGSGTGTAGVNVHLTRCRFMTRAIAANFFVNTGTSARVWGNDCRFDNDTFMYSTANDSGYNAHAIYIHPSVARAFTNCRFLIANSPGPQGAYHVHDNGSPTDTPDFIKYDGVIIEAGKGSGILSQNNATLVEARGCQFYAAGVQLSASASLADCVFGPAAGGIGITGTGMKVVIRNPTFLQTAAGLTPINMSNATGANTIILQDAVIPYLANWTGDFIALGSSLAHSLDMVNCRITGITGVSNGIVQQRGAQKIRVVGGVYTGTAANGLFYSPTGANTGYFRLQDADLSGVTGTAVYDQATTGTDGPFRVISCLFGAAAAPTRSDGRTGNQFSARPFTSPTAVTPPASNNPLVLDHDFARYTCTPTASINLPSVFRSTAPRTKMCSEEVIIRNTAAAGSGFNLVFQNAAGGGNMRGMVNSTAGDVTCGPGDMVVLIGDGAGNWDVRNFR